MIYWLLMFLLACEAECTRVHYRCPDRDDSCPIERPFK
jgi:hypothetical protein